MVYNMLVAPARLLGLGLIITGHVVVSLILEPQYHRRNSSYILLKNAIMGFLQAGFCVHVFDCAV